MYCNECIIRVSRGHKDAWKKFLIIVEWGSCIVWTNPSYMFTVHRTNNIWKICTPIKLISNLYPRVCIFLGHKQWLQHFANYLTIIFYNTSYSWRGYQILKRKRIKTGSGCQISETKIKLLEILVVTGKEMTKLKNMFQQRIKITKQLNLAKQLPNSVRQTESNFD